MQKYQHFEPLKVFLEICAIPHASFKTEKLKEWIIQEARKANATIQCDKVGNVLCSKGKPKLCLQGHYDMVYVGDSAAFEVKPKFVKSGNQAILCAEDSSLGADNGAALASMIVALRKSRNIECLFTIDEEVGMLGAREIALPLQSPYMLNCDSEEIDEVVVSCAGGYDLECKAELETFEIPQDCDFLEIRTQGFRGGHSGIEIHKNISNAILELAQIAKSLVECGALVVKFCGGEKRNSIPTNALLQVAIPQNQSALCKESLEKISTIKLEDSACFEVVKVSLQNARYFNPNALLQALLGVQNGVIVSSQNAPILSSNVGILQQTDEAGKIQVSFVAMGRSNQESLMQENIKKETKKLEALGFCVDLIDVYAPWEREESALLNAVWEIVSKQNPRAELKSIHAGLECGILKQKYPSMRFVSVGPSISHPHSLNEQLDLESFVRFDEILQSVLERFQAF